MVSLIISHAEDPDGIIARALLMRCFGASRDMENHVLARYDRIVEAFQEALQKAEEHGQRSVYISDIDLNPRLYAAAKSFSLLESLAKERKVVWFDHHRGTLAHRDELSGYGINLFHDGNQCAAMLIAQQYSLKENYGRKLAKIAQAHDYKKLSKDNDNSKIGDELEKIIVVANEALDQNLLLELSADLAEEKCFNDKFNLLPNWKKYADEFDKRSIPAYQELDESIEIIDRAGYKILFGYSPSLLSQKPATAHLRKCYDEQADIFVCLYQYPVRNHMVFAGLKSSFRAAQFVLRLSGGGSEERNGGGFSLDYDITPENYSQVKEMLLAQIESYVSLLQASP